jgi:hypothetical protein
MNNVIINTGKTTTVTIDTCHNVTVNESSIVIDLVATLTKPKTTNVVRRGRPPGAKSKTKKTVKK